MQSDSTTLASESGTGALLVQVEDGVAAVTINREARRNALTMALWRLLGETFGELDKRQDVRAIVLTGRGKSFCAGADVSEFAQTRADASQAVEYERAYDNCCDLISAVSKPTIAAINGFCMGGGCNVAMSCDFRFAVPEATFAIPAARLSIVYGIRGTRRLMNLVGLTNAKRILYSAEKFDASRGMAIGFVDEIATNVYSRASEFAQQLEKCAPLTISGTKMILNGLAVGGEALDNNEIERILAQAAQSYDYQEGRAAFAEKREPRFRGE
ncbi:enoyl-CoA hydratase-related protein [Paraburkholderia sediminicola]|uniref:enoyl-CoA hydratase-related protein n=1 Tax=Paraburkholderia sediminicola TaxID=458836 RepID=UPI0038B93657